MTTALKTHYGEGNDLANLLRSRLEAAGKAMDRLKAEDLGGIDEFHIRGRQATLELAERMELAPDVHVLDIGSGLGGPARTLATAYGCRVMGIDLARSFCDAAAEISRWLGLDGRLRFVQGDATDLPFGDASFDAAMTIHAAMNIADKAALYRGARRVLRPGGVFAVYDVLRGEGGPVHFPVPWARDPSMSHLASPQEMRDLLAGAGFDVLDEVDSTRQSHAWFEEMTARMAKSGPPPVSFQLFLGEAFPQMVENQVRNLAEDRIRTVAYICRRPDRAGAHGGLPGQPPCAAPAAAWASTMAPKSGR